MMKQTSTINCFAVYGSLGCFITQVVDLCSRWLIRSLAYFTHMGFKNIMKLVIYHSDEVEALCNSEP